MDNLKNLIVWHKSIELAVTVYKFTGRFPKVELYGITFQIKRCVVSISSNIAEGAGRNSRQDFRRFLNIAYSSACELETQLILCKKLEYVNENKSQIIFGEIEEIQKMLYSLNNSLK